MNFYNSFKDKTILIPLLQRDYVQGGREDVISPFLDALLGEKCDLNYIYGYEENNCFVPVDGQQRLITLWLLHLYLYASNKELFNIKLKFSSREFAEDFCESLQQNIESLLDLLEEKNTGDFDKIIIDQSWFINSWLSSATVRNMLGTLKILRQKITPDNLQKICGNVDSNITFAFLQMNEDNGLDDDIYVKMNGRGRQLSPFENLKSYMDEQVLKKELKFNDGFWEDWQKKIDNEWTDLFWKNRNKGQECPEEIDDEQLYFFYNMLILYHFRNESQLLNRVTEIQKGNTHLYDELLRFLDLNLKENAEKSEIVSSIILRLQKAKRFPLVWFERLHLFNNDFYKDVYEKLNRLLDRSQDLKEIDLFLGEDENEKTTTKTYQLAMCEGSFNRTLPLLYAVLCYEDNSCTQFFDWMRTIRNLILNTEIGKDNLPEVLNSIEEFKNSCKEQNIYEILEDKYDDIIKDKDIDILKGFNKQQVKEEIKKANYLKFMEHMLNLENTRFFRGCIGVLFRFFSDNIPANEISEDRFCAYAEILEAIFDGNLNPANEKENFLFQRALMTYAPFGRKKGAYWSFCNGVDEWRDYLRSEETNIIESLKQLMDGLIEQENKDLGEFFKKRIENFEKDFLSKPDSKSYHQYYFVHYPEVWKYMGTKKCIWNRDNDFDIMLKSKDHGNSKQMDLRTYGLRLDYDKSYDIDGWSVGIWERGNSCMFFEKEINNFKIAIDVYFYDDEGAKKNENSYSFDLFIRSIRESESAEDAQKIAAEDYRSNLNLFSPQGGQGLLSDDLWKELKLKQKGPEDGRLHSSKTYSKEDIEKELKKIMDCINKNCLHVKCRAPFAYNFLPIVEKRIDLFGI